MSTTRISTAGLAGVDWYGEDPGPRRIKKKRLKASERAWSGGQVELQRLWNVCQELKVPRDRSIPWLLSLAGSSVSDVARVTGSHRTSVHSALCGDYKAPLPVWRELIRVLGFDPFATEGEADEE